MTETAKILGGVKVRYDWFQTDTHVILNILHKNIDASLLEIDYQPRLVIINIPGLTEPLELHLSHEVNYHLATSKVSPSKLEIRLSKVEGIQWRKLEGEDATAKSIPKTEASTAETSGKKAKNWDEVVNSEKELDEGDPLNDLFKKIYSDGSDEVRKAMNKSFMESGGTVLSTNWKEVKSDKVDIKPPEGMEWKKWD